jgi:hypothetical protein
MVSYCVAHIIPIEAPFLVMVDDIPATHWASGDSRGHRDAAAKAVVGIAVLDFCGEIGRFTSCCSKESYL